MTEAEYKLESKLWKALKDDRVVMLGLAGVEEGHSQPMSAQTLHDEDARGPIWFFTSKETDLVKEIGQSHRASCTSHRRAMTCSHRCTASCRSTTIAR